MKMAERLKANDHVECHTACMGRLQELVQRRLVAMDPRRREHLVDKAPAEPDCSVQPSVLIERKQRFRVGFKPSAEFRLLATLEVTAYRPVITEGTTDPARSLNE